MAASALTTVPFMPRFPAAQLAPPSSVLKVPKFVPAHTVPGARGSARTAKTVARGAGVGTSAQAVPPSTLFHTPPSSVPAQSVVADEPRSTATA